MQDLATQAWKHQNWDVFGDRQVMERIPQLAKVLALPYLDPRHCPSRMSVSGPTARIHTARWKA